MKKIALVLSGGGFKGAFQLGALDYIRQNWAEFFTRVTGETNHNKPPLQFDIISGVSVGSLNGFLLAMGEYDKLIQLWSEVEKQGGQTIYTSDFIKPDPVDGKINYKISYDILRKHFPHTIRNILLRLLFNPKKISDDFKRDLDQIRSIADNTPLKNTLLSLTHANDSRYIINTIAEHKCIFRCGFVPLDTGKYAAPLYNEFINDVELCNAVLASTTMPVVWSPVPSVSTQSETFNDSVDGGIIDVSPMGDVIKEINKHDNNDDYVIVVINCSNGEIEENQNVRNIAQIAVRSLTDIAITEIFNNDLKEFLNINSILAQLNKKQIIYNHYDWNRGETIQKRRKRFKALIIQPDHNLGDSLLASGDAIRKRRRAGYEKADKVLAGIRQNNFLA